MNRNHYIFILLGLGIFAFLGCKNDAPQKNEISPNPVFSSSEENKILPEIQQEKPKKEEKKPTISAKKKQKKKEEAEPPSPISIENYEEDDVIECFGDDYIPYFIEHFPIFMGCETLPRDKQMECFKEKLKEHISKHVTYPTEAQEQGIEGSVLVVFQIDKEGIARVIKTSGADTILQNEAKRIIEKLPKFIPARQRGRRVTIDYQYVIKFKLI